MVNNIRGRQKKSWNYLLLTIVCERISISEVDEGRECFDGVSFGQGWVYDSDKQNTEPIQFVVNLLKLAQDLVAGTAVRLH